MAQDRLRTVASTSRQVRARPRPDPAVHGIGSAEAPPSPSLPGWRPWGNGRRRATTEGGNRGKGGAGQEGTVRRPEQSARSGAPPGHYNNGAQTPRSRRAQPSPEAPPAPGEPGLVQRAGGTPGVSCDHTRTPAFTDPRAPRGLTPRRRVVTGVEERPTGGRGQGLCDRCNQHSITH